MPTVIVRTLRRERADSFSNEAYSTKILEFMSVGVPVAVSSTKVDRYYFNDTVVRFFESGNHEELAKAMHEVLSDSTYRESLVAAAGAAVAAGGAAGGAAVGAQANNTMLKIVTSATARNVVRCFIFFSFEFIVNYPHWYSNELIGRM